MNEITYKDYVKKGKWKTFVDTCHKNSIDFYGCGTVLTAHLVMRNLMKHKFKGVWREPKQTPKEAWELAFKETPFHSGMSAACVAVMVARYSPRGDEFKEWCKLNDVVMVAWD
jgi:hypothetical protein